MNEKIKKLKEIIESSNNIVLFTGAGISVPSGIPDFRSAGGLYNQGLTKYGVSPETVISHTFYKERPEDFFEFYREHMVFANAEPNVAHKFFAELEQKGKLGAIVTQNIDGLHEKAGSKNVFNIHGNIHQNFCEDCFKRFGLYYVLAQSGVPRCDVCGGIVRPKVVLYEEGLYEDVVEGALEAIEYADALIVVGTSLVVHPAARYINYYGGDKLVLINLQATPYDNVADLVINDKIENVIALLEETKTPKQKSEE